MSPDPGLLPPRLRQVYLAVIDYTDTHHVYPAQRDITAAIGASSRTTVTRALNALEAEGYIHREHVDTGRRGSSRAIRVTGYEPRIIRDIRDVVGDNRSDADFISRVLTILGYA